MAQIARTVIDLIFLKYMDNLNGFHIRMLPFRLLLDHPWWLVDLEEEFIQSM